MTTAMAGIFAVFAILCLSDGQGLEPQTTTTEAQTTDEVLRYYPEGARAGGVEGEVELSCQFTKHAAMKDCALVGENPSGQGFGQAALALSRLSTPNPNVTVPPEKMSRKVVFKFRLHPPAIEPNPLVPPHIITNPDIIHGPAPDDVIMAYPKQAHGSTGRAVLDCVVTVHGKLDSCTVIEETPPGLGFGDAALKLTRGFKMKPRLLDGVPIGGAHGRFPFTFYPPN